MSYPVEATPDVGSAPTTAYTGKFIPELWAGKIIEKFYASTVLGAIANTDYEGEITAFGDKVNIRQKPSITIGNYQADGTLSTERPSSDTVVLNIDQGRYWSTILDDVMKVQADMDMMSMWSDDAAQQMKINIDTHILSDGNGIAGTDGGMFGAANALNRGVTAGAISGAIDLGATGDPIVLTADNAITTIIAAGQALDEQNIPETGRWIVIPAYWAALIKSSDLKDASLAGDATSIMRNGRLGMIDRFTVYVSNLLPTLGGVDSGLATGEFACYAGHSTGLTFASQLTKVETLRAETTFGTIMRGLQVFGFKVTDDTALVQLIVS